MSCPDVQIFPTKKTSGPSKDGALAAPAPFAQRPRLQPRLGVVAIVFVGEISQPSDPIRLGLRQEAMETKWSYVAFAKAYPSAKLGYIADI